LIDNEDKMVVEVNIKDEKAELFLSLLNEFIPILI